MKFPSPWPFAPSCVVILIALRLSGEKIYNVYEAKAIKAALCVLEKTVSQQQKNLDQA